MQPNACSLQRVKEDMANVQQANRSGKPSHQKDHPPHEISEIVWPAFQVGGVAGITGLVAGGFGGVIRSNTPVLFALASGIQWFTLATTFTASRGFILQAWGRETATAREKISACAIAGGVAGTAGGLLRGRKNMIPGAIMFALFGAVGQALYNSADARHSAAAPSSGATDLKSSWLNSKWSPVKVLSDREYKDMLQEKLLKVNVEIALVDESMKALREQERE